MDWNFEPITLERQSAYRDKLTLSGITASDYSFINLWGWAEEHGLQWSWQKACVWILQTRPQPVLWAPVGPWRELDWPRLSAEGCFEQIPLKRIPEPLATHLEQSLGSKVRITEDRGHWDYLYDITELVELKGNRFHKKKNLLNQFLRKYDSHYLPLTMAESSHALSLQADWCEWRDCESQDALAAENRVIQKLFRDWDRLQGIGGGALRVADHLVAYTISEAFTPDTLLIHIEKGDPAYKGAYQAINQVHLGQNDGAAYKWVNREQDLGDEGLRKAKLSYHPAEFIRKYSAHFSNG